MNKIPDGGPAFPRPLSKLSTEEVSGDQDGMTLRDWFAGQALIGLAIDYAQTPAHEEPPQPDDMARDAYLFATAMLAARGEKT